MKRILLIAAVSGLVAGLITAALFFFVLPSAWLFFIIPAIMGTCIHKFGKIDTTEVEYSDSLEKKVGYICAGAVLVFIALTVVPITAINIMLGYGWQLLQSFPFYIITAISVYYDYNRGVQAVVDSYYDSNMEDNV